MFRHFGIKVLYNFETLILWDFLYLKVVMTLACMVVKRFLGYSNLKTGIATALCLYSF